MATQYIYEEGATYQSESTPIVIKKLPTGEYTIKASKDDMEGETTFTTIAGRQDITIQLQAPAAYYSIIYDKSLASDPEACLTYAGACAGFNPMRSFGGEVDEGSWAEGNGTLFDEIKVGYFTDGPYGQLFDSNWNVGSKSAVSAGSRLCYTRIPKIYQKVTDLGDSKVQLDLSLEQFDGATVHSAFIVNGVEKDYIYIGRYLASTFETYLAATSLQSASGKSPVVNATRATLRTYAGNHYEQGGDNPQLMSYYDWDLVNKLYLLAFKDFDSQTALGAGYTGGSAKVNTGGTDGQSWMYGTTDSTTQISFLGLEDWWGNIWQFIDDFYGNSGVYYAGSNSTPTDDSSNKDNIGSFAGTSGTYPLTVQAGLKNFFLSEATGGSASAGVCDYQYWDTGENLGCVGGGWNGGSCAGAFDLGADDSLSHSSSSIGARLTYKP